MVIPGVVFLIMFRYIPLAGIIIAFQDYMIFKGILASPFVGFKHFESLFAYSQFWRVLKNTAIIGLFNIVFVFPVPVILALMFNELKNLIFKRTLQTIYYVPHFFSWVIISALAFDFLSISGVVNSIRGLFGFEPYLFMQSEAYFRPIVVLTSIWREAGWGTIVLLAAISGINPELYEASMVDGASRVRQMFNITLPLLVPTIVVLLLLNIGGFLDLSFEQIYNLLTPLTYPVGDVIDTYVYRVGIVQGQYSSTTAIGLFQSTIGFILVIFFNSLARRYQEEGGMW
ncbi:sugar ABC transporter permease [Paenibacillus contaminans]|uniref:Sugar ABC transporter permease n=2 Tax=Paenibacillus contaminans TaxID=450362 RepID=A0A329MGK6_9BACL|nr:sugar ABC transporter permease [Paenibacillus contaminans]